MNEVSLQWQKLWISIYLNEEELKGDETTICEYLEKMGRVSINRGVSKMQGYQDLMIRVQSKLCSQTGIEIFVAERGYWSKCMGSSS